MMNDEGLFLGLTALDPRENDFDNMLRCVKELKEGKTIMKPIYNHVNGTLDADEKVEPTPIIIFEVRHMYVQDVCLCRDVWGVGAWVCSRAHGHHRKICLSM